VAGRGAATGFGWQAEGKNGTVQCGRAPSGSRKKMCGSKNQPASGWKRGGATITINKKALEGNQVT